MPITNDRILALAMILGAAVAAAAAPPMIDAAAMDPAIPAPDGFLGHAPGADAVRYEALVRYLHALDDASDLVTLTPYATTHEGRALYYLTITSPANHARLDQVRADAAKLADPRRLETGAEGDRIVRELPGIAWLAYSIHGDEVSPCDSAMVIAYRLAAGRDDATRRLRDELVILIDPLQNPDGRERYLAQVETLRGKVPNPDVLAMQHAGLWSAGRGNHYLFDLNRDWLAQVHPETRGRAAAIRAWHPHLLVDSHEMGPLDTYLFDPPREPVNLNTSARVRAWRRVMSKDQAAAFDAYGWSYYTGEWYEEWYPGYTNAWASLTGTLGLLYEQAGVSGALVRQPAGNLLTYEESVHHNVVSTFANLETLRANRAAILADLLADRREAISGEGPFYETFLIAPPRDASKRRELLELLARQGIEHVVAAEEVRATDAIDVTGVALAEIALPAGTIVIDPRQPLRALAHAILGFDPRLSDAVLLEERQELERGRGSRMYDVTAWNVPMAFNLEAYAAKRVASFATAPPPPPPEARPGALAAGAAAVPAAAYGYLIPFDDSNVYRAIARLHEAGVRMRAANKPVTIAGRELRRGAILVRGHENGHVADLPAAIAAAVAGLGLEVIGADAARAASGPDLGGGELILLQAPRVAIASQWPTSTTSFGAAWHLLDERVGLRVSPVNAQWLAEMDLRKYNVLVVPSAGNLGAVLGAAGYSHLRTWVEGGGTLILIDGAAAAVASETSGLSGVRRRRDVLAELDAYAEAVDRELAARNVVVDSAAVWGGVPAAAPVADAAAAPGAGAAEGAAPAPAPPAAAPSTGDEKALARAEEWARRFAPQGAIVMGLLDEEHWMCFGLGDRLPVPIAGDAVLLSRSPVRTPVRLADASRLRLSGLLWPEARERLARSAFATTERVGNGQVILFAHDPDFRGYWHDVRRLLLNAVFLGPGFNTDQPLPW